MEEEKSLRKGKKKIRENMEKIVLKQKGERHDDDGIIERKNLVST